jgi:hypothetical protein
MTDIITRAMRRVRPGITCAAADGPQEALRAAVALAAGQPVLFLYEKLAMANAALDAIGAWRAPADGKPGPESPVLSAAAAELSIPAPAGPEIRCSPASTVAGNPPSPAIGRAAAQGRPPTAPGPGRAGAAAAARVTPTATAGSGLTFSAALAVSALAAEAEQLVPSLTAAAERVASSAMLADTVTTVASPMRRAGRPTAWHRGPW